MSLSQSLNTFKKAGKDSGGSSGNKNDKVTKKSFNLLQTKSTLNNSNISNDNQLNSQLTNRLNLPTCSFPNHSSNDLSMFTSQLAHQPQQFKVEHKDSQFFLTPTNLSMKQRSSNLLNNQLDQPSTTSNKFLESSHSLETTKCNQDKSKLNNELIDLNKILTNFREELERIVNGRQNEIRFDIKQAYENLLSFIKTF